VTRLRSIALQALLLLIVVAAGWGVAQAVDPRVTTEGIRAARETAARQAGQEFLNQYVEGDGRVVRRDEGGDVVSEGQAYGMLIAVAVGDENRFRAIWDWTKSHLRRPDGLLSWRWADGRVTDPNSAADADLDAARSLVLAGRRFDAAELGEDGKRLGADILRGETVAVGAPTPPPGDVAPPGQWVVGSGRMVVAGNWATATPFAVDPGYFSPRAERKILHATADPQWTVISRTQRVIGWQLLGSAALPPDWAIVNDAGHAATDQAAGDPDTAAARLDQATALQIRYPTYFASAWVALGRVMLASSLLGDCPVNGERFLHRDPYR
jgi:endo-1,4-beta-D-glucanase Y